MKIIYPHIYKSFARQLENISYFSSIIHQAAFDNLGVCLTKYSQIKGVDVGISDMAEEQRNYALSVLLETGALTCCQFHEDCMYEDNGELEPAFKRASSAFKRGELDSFDNQRDVTDTIKQVFEEYAGIDYCPSCDIYNDD